MTGILILTAFTLTIIAILGRSTAGGKHRQIVRTKLDLLAAAGSSKPFAHKPLRTPPPRDHHRLAA